MSLKIYFDKKLSDELVILLKKNTAGLDMKAIMTAVSFRHSASFIKELKK